MLSATTVARLSGFALLALLLTAPGIARADEAADAEAPYSNERTRRYRLQLDWHPIGLVVPEGQLRLASLIRMHPSGFRADEYTLYLAPTYGLGDGWEVTAGVTGAERLGRGGNALFYGAGVQKQLLAESRSRPAVSVGVYGMTGPHSHHAGTLYLAATRELWSRGERKLFLHGGGKYEFFDSDDYDSSTGVRPYAGTTVVITPRLFLGAEVSPPQPWETSTPYALRATVRVYRRFSISGGVRNNGFDTETFIGLGL